MSYKNPTGPQKFKKKDTDQLSEKRKLQMGIPTKVIRAIKNIVKGQIDRNKKKKKLKKAWNDLERLD